MNQYERITLNSTQLFSLYKQTLPVVVDMAKCCNSIQQFRARLRAYAQAMHSSGIIPIIDNDGTKIHEISTDKDINLCAISLLQRYLISQLKHDEANTDLFVDLYHLLWGNKYQPPGYSNVISLIDRWPKATDDEIKKIQDQNRERIKYLLIDKIDAKNSRYSFKPKTSRVDKIRLIDKWWNDFRFQLAMALRNPDEINRFLSYTLSADTMKILHEAVKKDIPFFVTPYYLSLLNINKGGYDDNAVRSYILYSKELVKQFGKIKAWEREDEIIPGEPNVAGWILPAGNNVHRRYPEVAILIPDTMGRACGGLCASCQRMYNFQSKRSNFDLESLRPNQDWNKNLDMVMKYFEEDTQLRDILVTGGDALMSSNSSIQNILNAIYKMALKKRRANAYRNSHNKYAEIQRIRLGTRLPVYLPMRIDDALINILYKFRRKARNIGITQFYIQTHFQSPLEITNDAINAIHKIQSAGWTITNQLVYTTAVSRRGHNARLRQILNSLGVVTYYTFTVKGFKENYALYAPNSRSVQEKIEEKFYGLLNEMQSYELYNILLHGKNISYHIKQFLRKNQLPFIASDRNVMNLPGIGKSMTFTTIGITPDGERILKFEHDSTRHHSPKIDNIGDMIIVENKSIAAYLRQLHELGEDLDNYSTIWGYTFSKTEPKFSIYEYPKYQFPITSRFTNLAI